MDLQSRKLNFIQEFLRLKNEDLINKLERLLRSEKQKQFEENLNPMSLDEFNQIIDSAEKDSISNNVTPARDLKKEIDSWQ